MWGLPRSRNFSDTFPNPFSVHPTYQFSELEIIETLPAYPIPSPTIAATPGPDEPELDTSPLQRIRIPSIELDTVVAFVPYDGQTWLIRGLREEIAWMGDTSWPGLGGNTGLAGHVTVRGMGQGPFWGLESLRVGDRVTLYTEKNAYIYSVREQRIVEEWDLSVIEPTLDPPDYVDNVYRMERDAPGLCEAPGRVCRPGAGGITGNLPRLLGHW
jgi:hypothetical protein